jgi:MFS family permease
MQEGSVKEQVGQAGKAGHPRAFYYGFVIIALIFIVQLIAFSLSDSFGVWLNPWVDYFAWSRASISGAYSLSFLVSGFCGILAGIVTDRFGPRLSLSFCAMGIGAGYALMSRMQSGWELYLSYGLLFGAGMSGIWAPLLSLVSRWFSARRGLMTGIVISGGGLGAFIGPPIITHLIESMGWSRSALILGIFALVSILASAQFLRSRPPEYQPGDPADPGPIKQPASPERDYSLREAIATAQFWLVFGLLFCLAYYTFSVLVHLVPQAIQLKYTSEQAAYVLASISGMSIVGNFVMGRIGDRIGPRQVFIVSFVLMSAALFWLAWARQLWGLYLFSLLFGFNHGGNATAQAPLAARIFGLKAHGAIFAACALGFTLGGSLGPLVSGYIFDSVGSYTPAFIICGVVGLAGLTLTALLKPTARIPTPI